MQRFNDPVPTPSPRRGDLRQPTINSFTPFSRAEDEDQLLSMSSMMRELIHEGIVSVEHQTWQYFQRQVDNLRGHQDIKDMFASLYGMEFIPSLRRIADILELIDTKLEDLEAQSDLEGVVASVDMSLDEIADADADVETDVETDAEADDDDVSRRLRF